MKLSDAEYDDLYHTNICFRIYMYIYINVCILLNKFSKQIECGLYKVCGA